MKQYIKIEAISVEDEEIKYRIHAGNQESSSSIEIYGYIDTFLEFANQLMDFPFNGRNSVFLKIGDIDDKYKYYFHLNVYCFSPNGETVIEVKIDNKQSVPYLIQSFFYILSIPYSVNELGSGLLNWDIKQQEVFIWEAKIE
jgi:hypothetical protein